MLQSYQKLKCIHLLLALYSKSTGLFKNTTKQSCLFLPLILPKLSLNYSNLLLLLSLFYHLCQQPDEPHWSADGAFKDGWDI